MATCNIIEGYTIPCRDRTGGYSYLMITEFSNLTVTQASGVVTAITQAPGTKFWKYSLEKENALFDDDYKTDLQNGTSWSDQTASFTLKGFTAKNKNNIRIVSKNTCVIISVDNNGVGNIWGVVNGMDCLSAKGTGGKMINDFNGITVNFTGKEPTYSPEVPANILTGLTIGQ